MKKAPSDGSLSLRLCGGQCVNGVFQAAYTAVYVSIHETTVEKQKSRHSPKGDDDDCRNPLAGNLRRSRNQRR